ncbi:sensor histidine kinase [Ammoniphilus sp. 3BR4]|uniref:cache domain-containing sensor histidine kinase n=1 Tax=Ammoniphilus sp. 3BR4 TaxID=3158265 RepID=UPI0034657B50
MKFAYSLRYKLSVLYLLIIVIPVLIISAAMPYYYQYLISKETQRLTEGTLASLSNNINTYLDDLSRLTIIPYLNENIMFAIKTLSSNQYKTAEPYTQLVVNRAIYDTLPKYLQFTREEIVSTILLTMDGSVFVNTRNGESSVPDYPFTNQEWYKKAMTGGGNVVFIPTHSQDYITGSEQAKVFSVARLIKDPETQKPLAVIMADADLTTFNKIFKGINLNNKNSMITILDDQGDLFYSNRSMPDSIRRQLKEIPPVIKADDDSYVVVSKVIPPSNWKMVVLVSQSEITAKVRWMFTAGILFAAGGLLVTFFLFTILSRWIVNPFKELVKVMKKVEKGHFEVRLQTKGQDEVARLGNAFNHMIAKINELIDREYRAVLNQRNAEYRALQSQIQPHFLYNTLNGFIGLNRMGERKNLEKAILSLSSMLRYSLQHTDWSTIADEFLFLERYCSLQRMRFQDRMEVDIHCDYRIAYYQIPKLLLQPLVENAIIHGVEPSEYPCRIMIKAEWAEIRDQSVLRISIRDNGVGFDPEKQNGTQSIGISNVRERLKMVYPQSTFTLESEAGLGTQVMIEIPEQEVRK